MRYFLLTDCRLRCARLPADPDRQLGAILAAELRLPPGGIADYRILARSLDARRGEPVLHYTVALALHALPPTPGPLEEIDEAAFFDLNWGGCAWPPAAKAQREVLVIGTGPAGIFAALALAEAGCAPLVLDRGFPVEQRESDYRAMLETRQLDPESNLLIGEGGAGTFSDGKLHTGTRDPRTAYILRNYLEAGAPPEIRYLARPHIGSDFLGRIATNLRQKIERLGGRFRFGTAVADLHLEHGRAAGVVTAAGEIVRAPAVILAGGLGCRALHAALRRRGVDFELKGFQLGCRIEHPQSLVDRRQYHAETRPAALEAAEYQLLSRPKQAAPVSTFCMCPGGEVVMASAWEGRLLSNGMSRHARDGEFANSALITTLAPDFCGSADAAFAFLEKIERDAFELGGGDYTFPAQDAAAFLTGDATLKNRAGSAAVGLRPARLDALLPPPVRAAIAAALLHFDRRLPGFIRHGKLIGVESCVSSPVRFRRDPVTLASSVPGLYLAGEGAGFAGGIISAAADGLRIAAALLGNSGEKAL